MMLSKLSNVYHYCIFPYICNNKNDAKISDLTEFTRTLLSSSTVGL